MNTTVKNTLLATAGAAAAFGGATAVASADSVTIKAGDTLYSFAVENGVSVNDLAEINNVTDPNLIFVGETLELSGAAAASTDASEPAAQAEVAETSNESTEAAAPAQVETVATSTEAAAPAQGSRQVSDASNSYPAGQCTWFVKNAAPWVGNNWGNASGWGASAAAAGRSVNGTPAAGSVVVFAPGQGGASGFGHVGVVDAVNADGSISISEGNYGGMAYHTRTISAAGLTFIH